MRDRPDSRPRQPRRPSQSNRTNRKRSMRRVEPGDEQDVYTGWRRLFAWTSRPGAVAAVKRRTHRRERRQERTRLQSGEWE